MNISKILIFSLATFIVCSTLNEQLADALTLLKQNYIKLRKTSAYLTERVRVSTLHYYETIKQKCLKKYEEISKLLNKENKVEDFIKTEEVEPEIAEDMDVKRQEELMRIIQELLNKQNAEEEGEYSEESTDESVEGDESGDLDESTAKKEEPKEEIKEKKEKDEKKKEEKAEKEL